MLGVDLWKELEGECELYGIDIKKNDKVKLTDGEFRELDITDRDKTYELITKINPELVIHTAAYTDVDGCEANSDLAYKVNMLGVRNVALACQRFDAALLYISTDFVFDGEKGKPYVEFDLPNPLSIYARSKYYGELYVQKLLSKFYIVRTAWLYGENGKNFVDTIINLAKEKDHLEIVNDQTGSPTYTKDLAKALNRLVTSSLSLKGAPYGIWHITNSGYCSWYDFAKEIINQLKIGNYKLKVEEIRPISSEKLNRPAKRPGFSVLNNFCWHLEGWDKLRDWKEALAEYLQSRWLGW